MSVDCGMEYNMYSVLFSLDKKGSDEYKKMLIEFKNI